MPLFFFDYRDGHGFTRDEIGLDLPNWETAKWRSRKGTAERRQVPHRRH